MTAPARISQLDIERAIKAVRRAGWEGVRMKIDLQRQTIDLFCSDQPLPPTAGNDWDEELQT